MEAFSSNWSQTPQLIQATLHTANTEVTQVLNSTTDSDILKASTFLSLKCKLSVPHIRLPAGTRRRRRPAHHGKRLEIGFSWSSVLCSYGPEENKQNSFPDKVERWLYWKKKKVNCSRQLNVFGGNTKQDNIHTKLQYYQQHRFLYNIYKIHKTGNVTYCIQCQGAVSVRC